MNVVLHCAGVNVIHHCAVIGDSIAVGVGARLPECVVEAKVGITARRYIDTHLIPKANITIVSLGANGGTLDDLDDLRAGLSGEVVWLLPARPAEARSIIVEVARFHGDRWIDTAPYAGSDGLHPTRNGYQQIAGRI